MTTYSRRRMLQLMGAAGLGAAGLAACAPTPEATAPLAADDPKANEKSFSFASWTLNEEAGKPVVQGLLDTVSARDGLTIDGISYPYNEYLNQLTLQVRGGELVGAAQLDIAWLGALASLGKLRDLGPAAAGRGYTQTALTSGQYEGKQFGLPWTTGAIGLVSNKDLMDRAGIGAQPRSIEDFEAALVELKGLGNGVVPYAASTKVAQLKDIMVWMQTFGCTLLDGDEVTIGDEASVDAVTWYKKLYDQKLIAPDVDRFDARALFSQGRAAIYDDAIVGKGAVVADSPDKELADKLDPIARPIVSSGDTPQALLWGHVIVVIEGEAANTATSFAQWMTSDDEATSAFFEKLALPPTTERGLASAAVASDPYTKAFGERVTATASPSPFWKFPEYAQMETVVAEQVQAVLIGSASPADAMRTARQGVQALIK
ncbi:MAG: extracellular solute-binding protein [Actinophytocola sp.]|uniref:extracellular solute-binding protein n=1 Tax=Actinophytocola sp. TaxID=1872138 RepID=UPI001320B010|nr:extracellular solute-binding protein [Actinophytocola sp.]MPZ82170.1 extracellular solute-binding protein [Actinophytocola sp.]